MDWSRNISYVAEGELRQLTAVPAAINKLLGQDVIGGTLFLVHNDNAV